MLRILTYHRVAQNRQESAFDPALISATPETFERQLRHLVRHYRVIGVEQLLDRVERGVPVPARSVLITFDDAYRDFGSTAWPILRRYDLPATLFVPTAFPDCPERIFWWDRLYRAFRARPVDRLETSFTDPLPLCSADERRKSLARVRRLIKATDHATAMRRVDEICTSLRAPAEGDNGVLGWDDLRRLVGEGVTLGAHTRTHPLLSRTTVDAARHEIEGSRDDLLQKAGMALPIISYPDGAHDARVIDLAHDAGFVLGFTTLDGLNDLSPANRLRLRRTNITRRTTPVVFRVRMLPPWARVDAWRHREREIRA